MPHSFTLRGNYKKPTTSSFDDMPYFKIYGKITQISAITDYYNDGIYGLQVNYGNKATPWRGLAPNPDHPSPHYSKPSHTFKLGCNEKITKIVANCVDNVYDVDWLYSQGPLCFLLSIAFFTNENKDGYLLGLELGSAVGVTTSVIEFGEGYYLAAIAGEEATYPIRKSDPIQVWKSVNFTCVKDLSIPIEGLSLEEKLKQIRHFIEYVMTDFLSEKEKQQIEREAEQLP
ncbi:hypothetical protein [Neochlamydia sp. S13]|uniref:hypothetical protein n=1 Tax=Neochlamydia sp. S13 TaxID=1353976 RepID=UPI000FD18111|nr:hypothetical protein [Neochlamydia sp. S13]BBI17600.1 hypothetical protein NCS13_1_1405 [Neochlamydia sp. S13]